MRNELQEARRMCADWEKGPVDLSIAEKRIPCSPPKQKAPIFSVFFVFVMPFSQNEDTVK